MRGGALFPDGPRIRPWASIALAHGGARTRAGREGGTVYQRQPMVLKTTYFTGTRAVSTGTSVWLLLAVEEFTPLISRAHPRGVKRLRVEGVRAEAPPGDEHGKREDDDIDHDQLGLPTADVGYDGAHHEQREPNRSARDQDRRNVE